MTPYVQIRNTIEPGEVSFSIARMLHKLEATRWSRKRAKHVERDFHVARGWTVEHARKQIHFPSKIHLHAVVHISLLKNKRRKRKKEKKRADTFEWAEKIKVALPTHLIPRDRAESGR